MSATVNAPIHAIDQTEDYDRIHSLIKKKKSLRLFYREIYEKYQACLNRVTPGGIFLEIGAGAGFAREVVSGLISTDFLAYPGIDQVLDATKMPYPDQSLRAIFMLNTFHHIPDVEAFLREADRCLKPGGRVLIVDQHPGWISAPILKHIHHEPFDPQAAEWKFESTGPLSGANGALAWMVFQRDYERFAHSFPSLRMIRYTPHSPLRYWLAGGLKEWALLPPFLFGLFSKLDRLLVRITPKLGSFVDIELEKI